MMSQRSPQKSLGKTDVQYLDFVSRDTFYGFLTQLVIYEQAQAILRRSLEYAQQIGSDRPHQQRRR